MDDMNIVRLSPLRPGGGGSSGLKSPSSGKSTPRGSPSFRRLSSCQTPRREGKAGGFIFSYCFRSNRIVLWLLLITLWAYAGFYFQSRWAHGDNKEDLFSGDYGGESNGGKSAARRSNRRDLIAAVDSRALRFKNETSNSTVGVDVVLAKSGSGNKLNESRPSKKRSRRSSRKKGSGKPKVVTQYVESELDVQTEEIPKKNTSYGFLVCSVEDYILDWSPEKRSGTSFARLVWSRKFVLIFHELSMTGAPLAMLELETEFLSCGATISVIVLNKKGDLIELTRRKIKVLEHKSDLSFKTAMKANLIIAGSAVCSNWIDQYLSRTVLGSTQIMWWIMENRRDYFDRSKHVLNRVKKLIFISESQSKQWLDLCDEKNMKLKDEPALVLLSVNDELAFAAGISCSLNIPSFTTENMMEKRQSLRCAVRHEMGLTDDDILAISLSSINPGKGQLLLMESARLVLERSKQLNNSGSRNRILIDHDYMVINRVIKNRIWSSHIFTHKVGSKSNKVAYVTTLLTFLSTHSNLSRSVLWTPATTRVASLYAAADVYAMNSQGIGETLGRVTIEAMVFGLPVLGTDSRGTREIVEHNTIDLLHPLGHPGSQVLARNSEFLLDNPSARQEMGMRGRVIWLLVALWAYAGFYFQSRWAQGDNREVLFRGVYGGESDGGRSAAQQNNRRDLIAVVDSERLDCCCLKDVDAVVAKSGSGYKLNENKPLKRKRRCSPRKKGSGKPKIEEIPEKNSTYGFLIGPYGSVEDSILEWSPEKRSGTCDWKGALARFVWSRKFVLSFHDLSMTGAPLAMLELATEFLSCGATISVIVLNKKGGLMPELTRRKIKVLEHKSDLSFKTAMKANLIIAGSAVCSNWIGPIQSFIPSSCSSLSIVKYPISVSKSNKVAYVKTLLTFLSTHSNLSRSVRWTPATTRVSSLYAAAHVYVMNSQGIGETFGRVKIEAMAFGLPVLGTDSGGTREIVKHNATGLLHRGHKYWQEILNSYSRIHQLDKKWE